MRPNIITTYIDLDDGDRIYIPASASFTTAIAWETVEQKSADSSGTSQSITVLKKAGRQGRTFQLRFDLAEYEEDEPLYNILARYDAMVGQTVQLTYAGFPFGRVIITDGTFTLSNDSARGISRLSVAFNLKSTKIYVPTAKKVNVRF